jgi:hypothetical protein
LLSDDWKERDVFDESPREMLPRTRAASEDPPPLIERGEEPLLTLDDQPLSEVMLRDTEERSLPPVLNERCGLPLLNERTELLLPLPLNERGELPLPLNEREELPPPLNDRDELPLLLRERDELPPLLKEREGPPPLNEREELPPPPPPLNERELPPPDDRDELPPPPRLPLNERDDPPPPPPPPLNERDDPPPPPPPPRLPPPRPSRSASAIPAVTSTASADVRTGRTKLRRERISLQPPNAADDPSSSRFPKSAAISLSCGISFILRLSRNLAAPSITNT